MMTLLKPFRYVTIRHRAKLLYDVVLPIVLGGAITALLLGLPRPVAIFGKDAYLGQLQSLLTILGGFFIAALTLITTDKNSLLSQPVGGWTPPRLASEKAPLSRRRFLAYLFGYLSTSSFVLVGMALVANLIAPQLSETIPASYRWAAKAAFVLPFNAWLAHVFVSTMLGLYYFTERLQIGDAQMSVRNPGGVPKSE
jgi:hypothetical protein